MFERTLYHYKISEINVQSIERRIIWFTKMTFVVILGRPKKEDVRSLMLRMTRKLNDSIFIR